jgi:SAM-dependent methyltransferase
MGGAEEWQGQVGSVWAAEWPRTDRSFQHLSVQLDQAIRDAAPDGAGDALDIGCGAGSTSFALAKARPDIQVTGLDVADDLVAVANQRAADMPNARFAVADLNHSLPELPPLDLLFSRHGVMFFDDPAETFAALRAAAKPGASLVFSCFRSALLNPWAGELSAAITGETPPPPSGYAPGPFGFADPDFTAPMLREAGWRDVTNRPVDYDYIAGQGDDSVADATSFFRRIGPVARALKLSADADRPKLLAKLGPILERQRRVDQILFPAAAWIWAARA